MTYATFLARCSALLLMGCGLLPVASMASEPGWRPYTVPASASAPEPITVALYYPTQAAARTIAMGPFTLRVAIQASPDARVKGLIVLSHGTGGSELAHTGLAEALARTGYLVAALRHPGDNWQDRSVWQKPPGAFFAERPRQVSRVIDALLADPDWKDRIATDARGPRIGALGHSAGGYTVVALVGGQVDLSRIAEHCRANRADDPIFCGMGRADLAPITEPLLAPTADSRVRAVVAMAPLGVMFTSASLAGIRAPVAVYAAELDRWLVPRFHAERIARNTPGAAYHAIPNAWHFAFMERPATPIPTADGDASADPPGFDRAALLSRLAVELSAWFDKALTQ